jgi:hypothetical protein
MSPFPFFSVLERDGSARKQMSNAGVRREGQNVTVHTMHPSFSLRNALSWVGLSALYMSALTRLAAPPIEMFAGVALLLTYLMWTTKKANSLNTDSLAFYWQVSFARVAQSLAIASLASYWVMYFSRNDKAANNVHTVTDVASVLAALGDSISRAGAYWLSYSALSCVAVILLIHPSVSKRLLRLELLLGLPGVILALYLLFLSAEG